MSNWIVEMEPRFRTISMHGMGLDYPTYWLGLDEAQDLAEKLLEAIGTLETFYDENLDAFTQDASATPPPA